MNRTATYWTPTLPATAAFSPLSLAAQPGAGGQPLLGHGSHSSIFSPTDLNFLSPGLYNNLSPSTSCQRHICSQFNPSTVKVIPWYIRRDAPVIYTGAFLLLTAWPGSVCYISLGADDADLVTHTEEDMDIFFRICITLGLTMHLKKMKCCLAIIITLIYQLQWTNEHTSL